MGGGFATISGAVFRILVVDDHSYSRYAASRALRAAGYEVSEAATGAEALRLARLQPDLILLDIRLPDLNGFEVCRQLRQDPATKRIAVVYKTAYMDERTRATREGMCADEIVVDEGDATALLETIGRLLSKAGRLT